VAGLTAPMMAVVAILLPIRLDHLLAIPFQFTSMFLIYCMMANVLAILAPMPVASGSLKPVSPKGLPMVLHMLFVFALPTAMAPTLFPIGVEAALEALEWSFGLPICLVLTALEAAAVVMLYRSVITAEGRFLQAREQKILDVVVVKAE
jgi:ABC-2 type transport system permease protein